MSALKFFCVGQASIVLRKQTMWRSSTRPNKSCNIYFNCSIQHADGLCYTLSGHIIISSSNCTPWPLLGLCGFLQFPQRHARVFNLWRSRVSYRTLLFRSRTQDLFSCIFLVAKSNRAGNPPNSRSLTHVSIFYLLPTGFRCTGSIYFYFLVWTHGRISVLN